MFRNAHLPASQTISRIRSGGQTVLLWNWDQSEQQLSQLSGLTKDGSAKLCCSTEIPYKNDVEHALLLIFNFVFLSDDERFSALFEYLEQI